MYLCYTTVCCKQGLWIIHLVGNYKQWLKPSESFRSYVENQLWVVGVLWRGLGQSPKMFFFLLCINNMAKNNARTFSEKKILLKVLVDMFKVLIAHCSLRCMQATACTCAGTHMSKFICAIYHTHKIIVFSLCFVIIICFL